MIESLRLENFRGFEDHTVPFRELTIMVGANNAGKSTAVEALRLVALVTERFRAMPNRFFAPPPWLDHPSAFDGVAPAVRARPSEGQEANLFHRYGDPPAVLTAEFTGGSSVTVFVGPEAQIHGVARRADGSPIGRGTNVAALGLPEIAVQPQVAPLLREEPIRRPETIRRGDGTYLAPQHFRNQLWLFDDPFQAFCEIAEETWPGLQITELDGDLANPNRPLQLRVRDGAFVGEVSLMGHGLQMWLQMVWFLARASPDAAVVLDEPDVYMHPDLQRRLLELVRDRFKQLMIATHSIEIVSDVDPQSILSIDRSQSASTFVTTLPGLQEVLNGLGAVQNVQVARLLTSRSFYLVEGEDVKLLRILQGVVAPNDNPIDLVPHAELGGRGGWGSGVPARLPTKNAQGTRIRSYCLLDRDYFPDAEVAERYQEASQWSIELRIWSRKELENYLLVPESICRHIAGLVDAGVQPPSAEEVADEIERVVADQKDLIHDAIAQILLVRDKKGGLPKANKEARSIIRDRWQTREGRWAIAPGKTVISRISDWSKRSYGVSFGPEQLARAMRADDVAPEVADAITAIAAGRVLKPGPWS